MQVLFLFLLFLLTLPAPALAKAFISCSQAFLHFSEIHHDSAVELEMNMSKNVLNILTTTDGTLLPVLGAHPAPEWLVSLAEKKFPGKRPWEVPWDGLSLQEKFQLLKFQGANKKTSFFDDRKIQGIRVRETVELFFQKETIFLGKRYPPGLHKVNVTAALGGKVEYMSPDAVKSLNGVELHFRVHGHPSDTVTDAWTFQSALGEAHTHQHIHIVAPLPERLAQEPVVEATRMADFFRRANLYSEIVGIFQGIPIRRNAMEEVIYFDGLDTGRLKGVTEYLLSAGKGEARPIGARFKMGWVGMRGSDVYDEPGLWGIEYRRISPGDDQFALGQSLDALQYMMNKGEWGISEEKTLRWLKSTSGWKPEMKAIRAMEAAWYHDSLEIDLFERSPTFVKKLLDDELKKIIGDQVKKRREIKMLLHDWSKDSLFFDDPNTLKVIEAQQILALNRVAKGENLSSIMQDFLWNSEIAKKVANSLQVDTKPYDGHSYGVFGKQRDSRFPKR